MARGITDWETSFELYLKHLCEALRHNDRESGLRGYCQGLMLPIRCKSGPWLKTALVTAAWAAVRTKNTYLHAQFLRIKARRGAKKAIVAVAASMLTAAWHMLRNGVEYEDLGPDYFNRHDMQGTVKRLLKRLTDLGYPVQPAAPS